MPTSKRILFVDDEPMVLSALQRSLHSMRKEWEMVFVGGGLEALQLMERDPFDIVVTDMRMPVMSGAHLLECVKLRFPQCLRIVLSGQADREMIIRSVDPTHQYLTKPCDVTDLKARIARAFAVRELLQNPELRGLVSKMEALPSLPSLYVALSNELKKDEASIDTIEQLISEDMAMTAKILQLVNSAFFGLQCRVSSARQAVQLLGLETIRALVLSAHVFDKFPSDILGDGDLSYWWKHSLAAANYANDIAKLERVDKHLAEDCFTSALLHDTGKVILASILDSKYRKVLMLVKSAGKGLMDAEVEILGCSHAEIGAFLLGLWGLPENVIEGVAFHHQPSRSFQSTFSTVAATHFASILQEEQQNFWMQDRTPLDTDFMHRIGCADHEATWRSVVS